MRPAISRVRCLVLAVGVLLAVAAAAHAQDSLLFAQPPAAATAGSAQAIDDIRREYRTHLGAFYVSPQLLLKQLGVDTNVFNQTTGHEQSDFTFTVTPQATIAVPFARRALVKAVAAMDAVYYQRFASERSLDPQATLRAEAYASRITFFGQDSYLNTRQRPNYEIDVRSRHRENDFGAGAVVKFTAKTSVEIAAIDSIVRYAGDAFYNGQNLKQTLDRDSTGFSVTARERLTPLTTVAFRVENLHDRFTSLDSRNADSLMLMPGIELKPHALINGSAFLGYRDFEPQATTLVPPFKGLVGHASISYTFLGATAVGVTYDRDVSYSYETAYPYFVDNSPGVYLRRELGGRFDVIASASTHRYRYAVVNQVTAPPQRTDTTNGYGVNVGYRLKHQARVGLGFSYYTRSSTAVLINDYNGLRIGTTVTYGF